MICHSDRINALFFQMGYLRAEELRLNQRGADLTINHHNQRRTIKRIEIYEKDHPEALSEYSKGLDRPVRHTGLQPSEI